MILASDFTSPDLLAQYLKSLNEDDTAYEEYLSHKLNHLVNNQFLINAIETRSWDDDGENFVEAFECFLCQEVHKKMQLELEEYSTLPSLPIDSSHFNCSPLINPVSRRQNIENWWVQHWRQAQIEADTINQLCVRNQNYSTEEFHDSVFNNFQRVED